MRGPGSRAIGDDDRPLDASAIWPAAALGALDAGGELVLVEQVEGRDVAPADPLERRTRGRTSRRCVRRTMRSRRTRPPPARRTSAPGSGNRARSISTIDGKIGASHQPSKCDVANVAITARPSGASTRASSGRARARSTRWITSRSTARSNQPSRNGSASALPAFRPTRGRHTRARDLEHRGLGVDRPDARSLPLGERGGEHARAAADLEHAPAAQVALADERVEDLPPERVRRAQLVVARGARGEIGRVWRNSARCRGAMVGARQGRRERR